MAEYRAIKTGHTRWGWEVQKRGWFGWTCVPNGKGHTEAEAQEILAFYVARPQTIYPSDLKKTADPLGIRNDTQ